MLKKTQEKKFAARAKGNEVMNAACEQRITETQAVKPMTGKEQHDPSNSQKEPTMNKNLEQRIKVLRLARLAGEEADNAAEQAEAAKADFEYAALMYRSSTEDASAAYVAFERAAADADLTECEKRRFSYVATQKAVNADALRKLVNDLNGGKDMLDLLGFIFDNIEINDDVREEMSLNLSLLSTLLDEATTRIRNII